MRSAKATAKPLRQHALPAYRRHKYSSRAFFLTVLVISVIAAFSCVIDRRQTSTRGGYHGFIRERDSGSAAAGTGAFLVRRDQE
ncbi:MAG: hypothetical protein LQ347_004635, partial [Umbilicaria vellea]